MASFGGSFRQAGISPSRAFRPNMPQRAPSTSSEASYGSDGSASDDQFAFSAGNTPSHEYPASRPGMPLGYSATSAPRDGLLFGKQPPATISGTSDASKLAPSKPIAIELPPVRKTSIDPEFASATTPPAPLSGRGDIPGGYFPLHEDPKLRVHRPHPFHLDATKARRRSLQRAAESMKAPSPVVTMLEPTHSPIGGFGSATSSSTHTPLSSYIPTGDQAALPLGKYYPSNYERRPVNNARQHLAVPGRNGGGVATKSESHVPVYRHDAAHTSSHNRTNSDVKRRLQQYQRDMVAQATMAASALLANKSNDSGGQADILATIQGVSLPGNVQRGGTMIRTHKPISPRLAPLGSPGPVTPMSLESDADGYLALDHGSKTDMLRMERERLEERGSPVAERGAPISV